MERNEILSSKDGGRGGSGNNGKSSGEGFIDRSKVRILLCDNDAKSSQEVFTLLYKCSYQVTSVRSPRQVIDALNAEGRDIDIILSEVDLPMAKGLKMLKYIMRDKELRRIPVIMMSAQDEVSVVVKCLRLGAADYLVKPLRTNELLNLWTHMWRRRQMLGLAEKNILNYDIDLVISDPSDGNTTLFSDDTDDKSRKSANPDTCMSTHQKDESQKDAASAAASAERPLTELTEYRPDVPGTTHWRRGHIPSCPKKSQLKIGESSAFFTYVKSSMLKSNTQGVVGVAGKNTQHLRIEKKITSWVGQVDSETQRDLNTDAQNNQSPRDDFPSSNSIPDSCSIERSCTPPLSQELTQPTNSKMDEFSQVYMHPKNDSSHDVSAFSAQSAYPYYVSGVMNQVMMSTTASMYQKNLQDIQNHATSAILPSYNHNLHCPPPMPGMAPYPYYPLGVCLQPGQMPLEQPWPSHGSLSSKLSKVDRREAALLKFRQKRKERCFDKKIRYVNRKKLAEKRPRVRGQFVRKVNGFNVDLNGQPASTDIDDEEEDEDDEED
ncbi:hypothetical protein RJ639_000784 [Escallonia herrerae]|uniref:Two-component response regulator-like APRR1 n=1 Tax=Escallonia herrerae TaxID=1293975 RepID=A0AA88X9U0_9ASTE|nr:hypothetical protein RJ639_000784 [Escallonia herrerae]